MRPAWDAVAVVVVAVVALGFATASVAHFSSVPSAAPCGPAESDTMAFANRTYCTASVTLQELFAGYSAWGFEYHSRPYTGSSYVLPVWIDQPVRGTSFGELECTGNSCPDQGANFTICDFAADGSGPTGCYAAANDSAPIWFTPDDSAGVGLIFPVGSHEVANLIVLSEE